MHSVSKGNTSSGHRFDYETPIAETVRVLFSPPIFVSQCSRYLVDASPSWRRSSRLRSLYWNVLLLGMAMQVISLIRPILSLTSILLQSTRCRVTKKSHFMLCGSSETDPNSLRLRHQQQTYTIHLDAKSLQPRVSWGRAWDVPYIEGSRQARSYASFLTKGFL